MWCRVEVASLHAAPDPASEQVTQALAGEPLRVLERRDGWARVVTAYDYPGWVRESALGPDPALPWLCEPRDGDVVEEALHFEGAPYLWGGMTRAGIDCSGLVHMAYRALGCLVPRDADQQEEAGVSRAETEAEPARGDLVTYGQGWATHIVFWLGDGRILHASGREGAGRVLQEPEPESLGALRRQLVRL